MIPANQIYEVRFYNSHRAEWCAYTKTSSYDHAFEMANEWDEIYSDEDRKIFNVTDPANEFEEGTVSK